LLLPGELGSGDPRPLHLGDTFHVAEELSPHGGSLRRAVGLEGVSDIGRDVSDVDVSHVIDVTYIT